MEKEEILQIFVVTELWGHFWVMLQGIEGRVPVAPLSESNTGLLSLLAPP